MPTDPRAALYGLVDNSSTPLSQAMNPPASGSGRGGIPTAGQEALQQPYIDPVQTAMFGPAMGMRAMLGSLALQLLNNQMGMSPQFSKLASVPVPGMAALGDSGPLIDEAANRMFGHVVNEVAKHGFELPDAIEIAQTDDPEFAAMSGYRGEVPQATDNYQRLLRGAGPLPYPGADIGRPTGLAALLADLRQHYNQLTSPTLQDTGVKPKRQM